MRKGMGKGTGKGYKNMMGIDPKVHSQSARGIKQPQRINPIVKRNIYADDLPNNIKDWKQDISLKSGTFQFTNDKKTLYSKLGAWKHPNGKWFLENNIFKKTPTGSEPLHTFNLGMFDTRAEAVEKAITFMSASSGATPPNDPYDSKRHSECAKGVKKSNSKFKQETELDVIMKKKFSGYDNKRLVDKANRDFKANKNTDDVDFEIARRKDLGLIKTKVGFDTIELIE